MQVEAYRQELERMRCLTREEYLARLKRESSGFTRGASKYRGVSKYARTHSLDPTASSAKSIYCK
jgi:AP2-like factor (ANT lineage)